ncbi:MAG: hypothetical protein K0R17_3937 [Rariglobus sp.]|jgi:hypothetical protein|nr:hypothetical protein [Rariglobus sp.]
MSFTIHDRQIRVDNCGDCKDPCEEQKAGLIDHADPCARCPRGIWHAWGRCGTVARPVDIVPSAPAPAVQIQPAGPSLKRRLVAYKRAGLRLLSGRDRHPRSATCAVCPHAIPTSHTGLYGCANRCRVCGGGDDIRMLMPATTCDRWPPGEPVKPALRAV